MSADVSSIIASIPFRKGLGWSNGEEEHVNNVPRRQFDNSDHVVRLGIQITALHVNVYLAAQYSMKSSADEN